MQVHGAPLRPGVDKVDHGLDLMELARRKWAISVLRRLAERPHRRTELGRAIGGVSEKVLGETLRYLQDLHLVAREQVDETAAHGVIYALTPAGEAARARLRALDAFDEPFLTETVGATIGEDWRPPPEVDMDTPSTARMYDYYLGGKDNFIVDREKAEEVLAKVPIIRPALRANRAFLHRAVRHLASVGVRQFIDFGTGIPTSPNVHEITQEIDPDSRIVYVDNDPIVLAHDRALLETNDSVVIVEGDLRQPGAVLNDSATTRLIDFDEPVAILFVAVFHFVTDAEDPFGIVTTARDAVPSGSYVAISHGVSDGKDPDSIKHIEEIYKDTTSPAVFRTQAQVRELFRGFDLVEPGLVDVTDWRPEPDAADVGSGWYVAGVGRKP